MLEDYWYNYGTGATDPGTRPVINVNAATGQTIGISSLRPAVNNIVIRDLNLEYVNTIGSPTLTDGMNALSGGTNWTVDDCVFHNFVYGSNIQGYTSPFGEVTVLHRIFTDSHTYPTGYFASQGSLFMENADLLISQSTYDRNGKVDSTLVNGNIYSHDMYVDRTAAPAVVWGNTITDSGSHGIWMKSGGIIAYNYLGSDAIPCRSAALAVRSSTTSSSPPTISTPRINAAGACCFPPSIR